MQDAIVSVTTDDLPSSPKARIVVVGTRGIPGIQGGVETHCEKLFPQLVKRGYDVTVIARKGYVQNTPYIYQGVHVIPTWSPRKGGLEAAIHTFFAVIKAKRLKADICHIHAVGPALWAPLARLLGMKVVVTHHGPDYDRKKWSRLAKRILRMGEAAGTEYAHRLIVISETIRSSVEEKFHRYDANLIFNGVDIPQEDAAEEVDKTLAKYGLLGKKYILAVGRLVPEKGFHDLVESVGGRDDITLVIAGNAMPEDEYSRSLRERAAELGVVMTGFVKGAPLRHLFRGASLFVLPSYHEGLPIALLEAMSFGKDVLVSDIAANRDIRLPSDRYFPVGNIAELHRAVLRRLAAATPTIAAFREIVRRRYDWSTIARQVDELYGDLLGFKPATLPIYAAGNASLPPDMAVLFVNSFGTARIIEHEHIA